MRLVVYSFLSVRLHVTAREFLNVLSCSVKRDVLNFQQNKNFGKAVAQKMKSMF
jgi:hypothetical protein